MNMFHCTISYFIYINNTMNINIFFRAKIKRYNCSEPVGWYMQAGGIAVRVVLRQLQAPHEGRGLGPVVGRAHRQTLVHLQP